MSTCINPIQPTKMHVEEGGGGGGGGGESREKGAQKVPGLTFNIHNVFNINVNITKLCDFS